MFDTVTAPDEMPEVVIPRWLDTKTPDVMVSAILDNIDIRQLNGHDRIKVLKARQRMASQLAARIYDDMVAVVEYLDTEWDNDNISAPEAAAAEIRAALRLTRRAADSELALAIDLKHRLPQVWAALERGDIDPRRARTIAHGTEHLTDDTARTVVDTIIDDAPLLTTGQLAAKLRKLSIETNPEEATDNYQRAVERRTFVTAPNPDGTGNLYGYNLPADRVTAIADRINTIARSLTGPHEARTIDQIRADIYLDLLDGQDLTGTKTGVARGGSVDLVVDLTTLAGLNDNPGELAGFGPVIADVARKVAQHQHDTQWRVTVTDPDTGFPVYTGVTRRRPTTQQRRKVQARYRRCVFPGCRMPAIQSDLDHRIPFAEGGPTDEHHLAPLCRNDHCIRHQAGWTYKFLPNGTIEWTSPLNHTYTTSGTPP